MTAAPTPTPPRAPSGSIRPTRPRRALRCEGDTEADLAIVGGGLSGLWAAVQAKQLDPDREVVLLEAESIGHGATGRSGGFFTSSLTHGVGNGMSRFPGEMPLLERLGRHNFDRTVVALGQFEIDCDLELNGDLAVALEPHEEAWLAEEAAAAPDLGHDVAVLDRDSVRAELDSPIYRGALWQRSGAGHPRPGEARLGAGGRGRVARRAPARTHHGFEPS